MNIIVSLLGIMISSYGFTSIQSSQFSGICHFLSIRIDGHPTIRAIHHIQCVVVQATYLTGNQFGRIQHFVAIAESQEYTQIKSFVSKRVVQSSVEFRLSVTNDRFIIFINHIIVSGQVLKLPHTRTNPAFITMIRYPIFQGIGLRRSIIIEIIYLIQPFGDVTIELS